MPENACSSAGRHRLLTPRESTPVRIAPCPQPLLRLHRGGTSTKEEHMHRIREDLWETRADSPFPGLTTHAYLWTGGPAGNVLFYSTLTADDFAAIEDLGGVAHQYLSHRDEAGPMLNRIASRFGSRLHAPAAELDQIGQHRRVDVPLRRPPRRRQRHRGHPHTGALPRQHELPGARAAPGSATCSPATPYSSVPTATGWPGTSHRSAMPAS